MASAITDAILREAAFLQTAREPEAVSYTTVTAGAYPLIPDTTAEARGTTVVGTRTAIWGDFEIRNRLNEAWFEARYSIVNAEVSLDYIATLDGVAHTYTAGGADTEADILEGLRDEINTDSTNVQNIEATGNDDGYYRITVVPNYGTKEQGDRVIYEIDATGLTATQIIAALEAEITDPAAIGVTLTNNGTDIDFTAVSAGYPPLITVSAVNNNLTLTTTTEGYYRIARLDDDTTPTEVWVRSTNGADFTYAASTTGKALMDVYGDATYSKSYLRGRTKGGTHFTGLSGAASEIEVDGAPYSWKERVPVAGEDYVTIQVASIEPEGGQVYWAVTPYGLGS